MAFDVDSALKAGYSRSEIADYLASQRNFDVGSARKAGYSDDEILSHLAESGRAKEEDKPAKAPAPAPAPAPEPPPSADPIDYSAAATSMQGEPSAAPSQGLIASVGKALRPEYRSVMEDYKPTPQQDQANRDQRLSYGAGPIRAETAGAADLVRSGMAKSEDPTVNRVAQVMQERGEPGVADLLSRASDPENQRAARRAKAEEFKTPGEWAIDTVAALGQGATSLVQLPVNIIAPGSELGQYLRDVQKEWQAQESEVLQAQRQNLRERIQSEDGFFSKYAATVEELVTNPALGLSEAVKQVPMFLGVIGGARAGSALFGGAVGAASKVSPTLALGEAISGNAIRAGAQAAGSTAGGVAASAVMAGGDAAGSVYERLTDPKQTSLEVWKQNPDYQRLTAQGKSSEEAIKEIATAKARLAAVVTAPLGVFGFMGAEASIASRGLARGAAQMATPRGAAKTFGKEVLGEQIEEGGTQFGGNVVTRTVDPSQSLTEGVPEAMGTALVTSSPYAALGAANELRGPAQAPVNPYVDQAARTLLDPQTYDPRMVSPELTVDPAKIRDQVSQATTVDAAVAAAENAAGTINVNIPAPLTAPVTPAIPAPMPLAAAPVAAPAIDPAVEQQFGFDKLRLQPAAAPAPMNAPRPQRIQGTPVDQLTDEQLDQIAGDESIPAITRRGASVELTARRSGATMEAGRVEPTLNLQSLATSSGAELSADGRVEPTLTLPDAGAQPAVPGVPTQRGAAQPVVSYRFAVIPQQPGVRDIPATSVGGTAAAQRAREAAQRSVDKYAAQTGRPVPAQFNPAPPELDAAVNEIAQAVNSQFGGRIYAYSDARPEALNGIAIGKIAFVNTANVDVNAARTSLHEFKHTIEQIAAAESRAGQTGTAAQKFVAEIDSIYDDMTEAGKRAYLENFLAKPELDALYNPATGKGDQAAREARLQELLQDADGSLRSEMTADFLGNRATDKQFWQEVAAADPEGFRGFVEKWLRIIDNLLAQLRGTKTQGRKESARVDKYVRDLNKAKMVAREALIAYSKATRGQQQQVQAQAASAPQRSGREATAPGSIRSPEYDSVANVGGLNERVTDTSRGQGVPGDAAQDGRAARQDGGGEVPSYGRPRQGAVSVLGRHYSPEPRQSLNGAFYGRGLKGAERDRLDGSADPRIRARVYFYLDNGTGITPEAGVGAYAHEVRLENIYDPATKLIPPQPNANAFESAVINAGFDGYLIRNFTTSQGAAVLLGQKHSAVPVKQLGQVGSAAAPAAAGPTTLKKGLLSREANTVDVSRIPGAKLRMGNLEIPVESRDAANDELARIGSDVRFSQREYKLDLEREERAKGKAATVTPEEQAAVMRDAAANKVPEKQVRELLKTAREVKKQYPSSAGWAPLKLAGLEVKTDEESGEQSVDLKWQTLGYGYNKPPGKDRAPAKLDEAWAGKVADSFYKLIKDIYARADNGDKNAQIIVGHQTWYRNVAEVLRREYGAQGDLLADLLGATSPNTPVDTNWKFSIDILRRFMKGNFNNELAKFDDYVKAGGVVSKYPAADKIRQVSGKLYGMNSSNAMKALLDMWRVIEPGSAPKARNFALNLIGQSNLATIDVWAARMLRRAADLVRGANLPRIPPPAEQGVSGNWNADSTRVTGEFGFGAKVMDLVSEKLAAEGISVTPPDLQAIAWFAEKELWGKNRWTTVTGEGGSFEENIEAMPVERYLAGWSIQQGERVPRSDQVSVAQARVMAMLVGDDSVVTARVMPTKGLYGGTVEESFDTEWTVEKGKHDPSLVMAEIAKIAGENEQYDMFVSRVLAPNEYSDNARPGVEIYFRNKRALDQAMPVLERFTARGQDGFTMAVDPRAKAAGEFIGVRLQYVPEISIRWDRQLRARLLKEGELEKELAAKTKLLDEIAAEVSTMEGVAFARAQQYDTVVVGKENYDEYIGRGAAGSDQGARSEVWFGQPVRAAVERAAARLARDEGPVDEAGVPDVGSTDTAEEVSPEAAPEDEAPAASARQRTAEEIPREELAGRRVSLPVLIEDTGQTATITLDAKDALDDVDERESAMQRLLECLRK